VGSLLSNYDVTTPEELSRKRREYERERGEHDAEEVAREKSKRRRRRSGRGMFSIRRGLLMNAYGVEGGEFYEKHLRPLSPKEQAARDRELEAAGRTKKKAVAPPKPVSLPEGSRLVHPETGEVLTESEREPAGPKFAPPGSQPYVDGKPSGPQVPFKPDKPEKPKEDVIKSVQDGLYNVTKGEWVVGPPDESTKADPQKRYKWLQEGYGKAQDRAAILRDELLARGQEAEAELEKMKETPGYQARTFDGILSRMKQKQAEIADIQAQLDWFQEQITIHTPAGGAPPPGGDYQGPPEELTEQDVEDFKDQIRDLIDEGRADLGALLDEFEGMTLEKQKAVIREAQSGPTSQ
jgi:hypothetical protein